jgi:hypothetical protein
MKTIFLFFIAALTCTGCYEIMPRNSLPDCQEQCKGSKKSKACLDFCNCIHNEGQPLNKCLDEYNKAAEDSVSQP